MLARRTERRLLRQEENRRLMREEKKERGGESHLVVGEGTRGLAVRERGKTIDQIARKGKKKKGFIRRKGGPVSSGGRRGGYAFFRLKKNLRPSKRECFLLRGERKRRKRKKMRS